MTPQHRLQALLHDKLTEIRLRNPSYSQRAYARKLGIGSAALSELMSGKRKASPKMARRIAERLALSPEELRPLVEETRSRGDESPVLQAAELSMDQFRMMADWYHMAILSLVETRDYRHDPEWVAARLGINLTEARAALQRLERLKLLKVDSRGRARKTNRHVKTSDEVVNLSLRRAHAQNLELAARSLEEDGINERDFTAVTLAMDPKKLPLAKQMIREFRDQLCSVMESGEKTEVHKLCIQLIPLSRG